jgi:competence protein ComEA
MLPPAAARLPDPTGLPPEAALALPTPSASWRDQLASLAAGLDLSLVRLLGGAALLAVAAVVGWRLLAPPPAPAEMQLPMADRAALTGDTHAVDAPPTPTSAPGSGEVVVHVVGAVPRPGVQHLEAGSRVVDAVHAAGGADPDADLARLNLAAVLTDGEQVYVLRTGEAPPTPLPAPAGTAATGAGTGAPGPPVDLNRATADELDALPGIGPATAAAIIATREEKGGFRSVDDLLDVRGIGDAKLAELRDRVKV